MSPGSLFVHTLFSFGGDGMGDEEHPWCLCPPAFALLAPPFELSDVQVSCLISHPKLY